MGSKGNTRCPHVLRVLNTNKDDFYAILDARKTASQEEIKQSYKKIAFLLHPDKNSDPGSEEAFKAVSRAFSVLNDSVSRAKYDNIGTATSFSQPNFEFGGDDIDVRELFQMFFGGGSSNAFFRSSAHRSGFSNTGGFFTRPWPPNTESDDGASSASLRFIVILMFIFFTVLVNYLFLGNPFKCEEHLSFVRSRDFPNELQTTGKVRYYVDSAFLKHFKHHTGSSSKPSRLIKYESTVESFYLIQLRRVCEVDRATMYDRAEAARKRGRAADSKRILETQPESCALYENVLYSLS